MQKLWLLDSIIDGAAGGGQGSAIADQANQSGPLAHIERCTLWGVVRLLKLERASESIFADQLQVERQQLSCVRFSYVAPGSRTPQQYRCQPALETVLETERAKSEAMKSGSPPAPDLGAIIAARVAAWLVPTFEAKQYGQPAYAQLRRTSPIQIRTGAEDGSEMGAFCVLKQPQREANLRLRLDEYLPVGLDAGLIYVT
jgi:hypothetical protein